jgi:acyl-CoA thioester hydrolase
MHEATPGARPLLVTLPLRVQTYDIDFAGHVNNQVYVRWLEDLRMELLRVYCPLPRLLEQRAFPVLVSTHITYKRSILLHDEPVARMWCPKMGRATITLEAEVTLGDAVCAIAVQRGILLELGTTRPVRTPRELVDRFHETNVPATA